jgi:hypothetical protein
LHLKKRAKAVKRGVGQGLEVRVRAFHLKSHHLDFQLIKTHTRDKSMKRNPSKKKFDSSQDLVSVQSTEKFPSVE